MRRWRFAVESSARRTPWLSSNDGRVGGGG